MILKCSFPYELMTVFFTKLVDNSMIQVLDWRCFLLCVTFNMVCYFFWHLISIFCIFNLNLYIMNACWCFNYKLQNYITFLFAAFTKLLCLPFYVCIHFNFICHTILFADPNTFCTVWKKTFHSMSKSWIVVTMSLYIAVFTVYNILNWL